MNIPKETTMTFRSCALAALLSRQQLTIILNKLNRLLAHLLVVNPHRHRIAPRLLAAGFGEIVQVSGFLLRVA